MPSKNSLNQLSALVYSTDSGRMCPDCRQAQLRCQCKARAQSKSLGQGAVRVSRETKGRGGKSVTLIKGLPLTPDELSLLGKQLRQACSSGGTIKDGVIEIQGDHAERSLSLLIAQGYQAKRSGG